MCNKHTYFRSGIFIILFFWAPFAFAQNSLQKKILDQINNYRHRYALNRLVWDETIAKASTHHAKWLSISHVRSHEETFDVKGIRTLETLQDRFDYYHCEAFNENITWVPNIAYIGLNNLTTEEIETELAKNAVDTWINSPGHRLNMLVKTNNTIIGAIGIGAVMYADSTTYAIVMNVGVPTAIKK